MLSGVVQSGVIWLPRIPACLTRSVKLDKRRCLTSGSDDGRRNAWGLSAPQLKLRRRLDVNKRRLLTAIVPRLFCLIPPSSPSAVSTDT